MVLLPINGTGELNMALTTGGSRDFFPIRWIISVE